MEKNAHIHSILSKIEDVWNRVPDWRFMQLFDNFLEEKAADCFYMEDDRFVDELEGYINRALAPTEEPMKEVSVKRSDVSGSYITIKVPESYTNDQIRDLINTNLCSFDFSSSSDSYRDTWYTFEVDGEVEEI